MINNIDPPRKVGSEEKVGDLHLRDDQKGNILEEQEGKYGWILLQKPVRDEILCCQVIEPITEHNLFMEEVGSILLHGVTICC